MTQPYKDCASSCPQVLLFGVFRSERVKPRRWVLTWTGRADRASGLWKGVGEYDLPSGAVEFATTRVDSPGLPLGFHVETGLKRAVNIGTACKNRHGPKPSQR